jgi:hypothetical protein
MTFSELLNKTTELRYRQTTKPVVKTTAEELAQQFSIPAQAVNSSRLESETGVLYIGLSGDFESVSSPEPDSIWLKLDKQGGGLVLVDKPYHLYGFIKQWSQTDNQMDIQPFFDGGVVKPAFAWQRLSYDYFLGHEGRILRHLDKETYIRKAAELGFTHVDVNGLAYPMSLETGPRGEILHMFYTYCAALDQFVYTSLNKGIYPPYYLAANMRNLKENSALAVKYGLVPGFTSFEPRSVPEAFFQRYPMLRGARVDHPFRSFKPRYNMTTTHPRVLHHYGEMMEKLLQQVPELGFLSIWTNDSGAGMEHTKSLYVGRNGGAYMIREWNDDDSIAQLAAENAVRFYRVLRDAAAKINPDFRVMTRMEPFYGEHDYVWEKLGDQVDVETTSLVARGWAMPYHHSKYSDVKDISGGSVYQDQFDPDEVAKINELRERNALSHFYFTAGPHYIFEPLMGTPYPKLTHKRLKLLHDNNVDYLAHMGGTWPPEHVPYNINHEVLAAFQFNPELDVKAFVKQKATEWAGSEHADTLLTAWDEAEEAIHSFPGVTTLYNCFGFTWYRLWLRPFVPNIEAIPETERAYYQDYMCTTHHNPNNVDLARDVLFQLTTPEKSQKAMERMDQNVFPALDRAIDVLENALEQNDNAVLYDQAIRLRALRCLFRTHRNVAAWVVGVHGYQRAEKSSEKETCRKLLKSMMQSEIENTEELKTLWNSGVEFMMITDQGETPLLYGDNTGDLFDTRIRLMREHMDDEPFVDENYIIRRSSELID